MKLLPILCVLLVLFASITACSLPIAAQSNTPIPQAVTPQAETPSPLPTFTSVPPTETPAATAHGGSRGSITLDVLKNFTYMTENSPTPIGLKDGAFSSGSITSRLVEPVAFGDLNNDGQADAAVILATHTGGTGTFFDLVALLDQNGAPIQASYTSIGDRQFIKNLQIENGRIVLDYRTQGINDPLCCPSEHRLRSYILEGSSLHLASEQVLNDPEAQATPLPDAIIIDQPATMDKVTSPMQVSGRVSQTPPEKKLQFAVTDMHGSVLAQGEAPVVGEPGGSGTFAFEFTLSSLQPGIIYVEVTDMANGVLRGRSVVGLLVE